MARSNDEHFIDFEPFEDFMKKRKHENHEKLIFFDDFGQFGSVHSTPEVKICLYTKFEVNRREVEKF